MTENVKPLENCLKQLLELTDDYKKKMKQDTDTSHDELNIDSRSGNDDNIITLFFEDGETLEAFTENIQSILKDFLPKLSPKSTTYLLDTLTMYTYSEEKQKFQSSFTSDDINKWYMDIEGLLESLKGYPAAFSGDFDGVKSFVEKFPSFKDKPGLWDTTLLYSASRNGHLKIIQYLIDEAHCSVNAQNRRQLKFALNEKGPGYDAQVAYGSTALHSAAYYNRLEVVQYLIGKGANYFIRNQGGETAIANSLQNAAIRGFFENYLVSNYLINGTNPLPDKTIMEDTKRPKRDSMWEYKPFLDLKWYKFDKAVADELHKVLLPGETFQEETNFPVSGGFYHVSMVEFVRSGRDPQNPTKNMAWIRCRGSSIMNFDCLAQWQIMFTAHPTVVHDPNKIPSLKLEKLPTTKTIDFKVELNSWYQCDPKTSAYIETSMNYRRRRIPIRFEFIGYGISLDLQSFEFHNQDKTICGCIRWIPTFAADTEESTAKYHELDNYNIPPGVHPIPLTTKHVQDERKSATRVKSGKADQISTEDQGEADAEFSGQLFASFMGDADSYVDNDDESKVEYTNDSDSVAETWTINQITEKAQRTTSAHPKQKPEDIPDVVEDKFFYDRVGELSSKPRLERPNTASRDEQLAEINAVLSKEISDLKEQLEKEKRALENEKQRKEHEKKNDKIKELQNALQEKEAAKKDRQRIFNDIHVIDHSSLDTFLVENFLLKSHDKIVQFLKGIKATPFALYGIPNMNIRKTHDGFVASVTGVTKHHDYFKEVFLRLSMLSNVTKSSQEYYNHTLQTSINRSVAAMDSETSSSRDWDTFKRIYRKIADDQRVTIRAVFNEEVIKKSEDSISQCITDSKFQASKVLKQYTRTYSDSQPFNEQLENSKFIALKEFINDQVYNQNQKGMKTPSEKSVRVLKKFINDVEKDVRHNPIYKGFEKPAMRNLIQALRRIRVYHQSFLLQLPLFESSEELLKKIQDNVVLSISTSTGSGKSTLLPALLVAEGYDNVLVTQPRRLPCTAISQRVNETMVHPGDSYKIAGWAVSGDSRNRNAQIKYLTDGLLKESLLHENTFFGKYVKSKKKLVLFIDEVHERSINIDICLALIARILTKRSDIRSKIKIIISSATLDPKVPELFRNIPEVRFDEFKAPFLGVLHKIDKFSQPNRNILDLVQELCQKRKRNEQILCFVNSVSEVKECCQLLAEISRKTLIAAPLIQAQQADDQQKFIENQSIFFATTVAETSLTFPSLKYVIDTGLINTPIFNPDKNQTTLVEVRAAESTIKQRLGRLGRTAPGEYYSIYDFKPEDKKYPTPQICQSDLAPVEFMLRRSTLRCGLEEMLKYLPNPPEKKLIDRAIRELQRLNILDNSKQLTDEGKRLASLPDFGSMQMAKSVLMALDKYNCGRDLIILSSILGVLNVSSILSSIPPKYRANEGDFMTLYNVMKDIVLVRESVGQKAFNLTEVCASKKMDNIAHIIRQALRRLETLEKAFNARKDVYRMKSQNSRGEWEYIAKSLLAGYGENVFVSMKELKGRTHRFTRYNTGTDDVAVLDLQSVCIRPIEHDPVDLVLVRDIRYSSSIRANAVISFIGLIEHGWIDYELTRRILLNDNELKKINDENILPKVRNIFPILDITLKGSEITISGLANASLDAELMILQQLVIVTAYVFNNPFAQTDKTNFDAMKRNLEGLARMAYIFDPMKWRWQAEAQVKISFTPTLANDTLQATIEGRDSKNEGVIKELNSFISWLRTSAVLRHPNSGVSPRILKPQVRHKYLDMEERIAAIADVKRTDIDVWKKLKGLAATRETRMEVVAWIVVTKFKCRVEGGFVRDWVVNKQSNKPTTNPQSWINIQKQANGKAVVTLHKDLIPNDLDVHLPLNSYFDIDKFLDTLHRYQFEFEYYRDEWRYIVVLDKNRPTGPFTMDLIEPHVALTHDRIDFDVNNLSVERDYTRELAMRVDITEKPYSIGLESIIDNIKNKRFCILRPIDKLLQVRIDKMISRGWTQQGEPMHVIPNPPARYDMVMVQIPTSSSIYKTISDRLTSAISSSLKVLSIDEIRNPILEAIFLGNKDMIAKQCVGRNANVRNLFHGTKGEAVEGIPKDGYDDRYWATTGKWGHGAYFAENPAVSHGYNNPAGPNQPRIMFYNKVILGNESLETVQKPNMMAAPKGFHSVHGKPDPNANVDEFIVYRYGQALPSLKITYKT